MANHAYIKFVPASKTKSISIDDVKEYINQYKAVASKTGKQLDWHYANFALPYTISPEKSNDWIYLRGSEEGYHTIILGIGVETIQDEEGSKEQPFIQVTLPDAATYGDKGKANELCKYFGKQLQGEVHLFNGRVMYFYKR